MLPPSPPGPFIAHIRERDSPSSVLARTRPTTPRRTRQPLTPLCSPCWTGRPSRRRPRRRPRRPLHSGQWRLSGRVALSRRARRHAVDVEGLGDSGGWTALENGPSRRRRAAPPRCRGGGPAPPRTTALASAARGRPLPATHSQPPRGGREDNPSGHAPRLGPLVRLPVRLSVSGRYCIATASLLHRYRGAPVLAAALHDALPSASAPARRSYCHTCALGASRAAVRRLC